MTEINTEINTLTIKELAKRWNVDRKTISKGIILKRLPAIKIGTIYRIPLKIVLEWENNGNNI